MKPIFNADTPRGQDDVQSMYVMAKLAIGRQIENRKPSVVEVARFSERALRMYFGTEVSGAALTVDHHSLIDAVALRLLKDFGVTP